MYKQLTVFFVFLAFVLQISECGTYGRDYDGYLTRSHSYRRNFPIANGDSRYIQQTQQQDSPKFNDDALQNLSERGLSLWALIFIMIAIIIAGFALYYGVMCYPFLCKTEKTYQFMEISSTMTGATSRSIQSIDNFQTEKH